MIQDIINELSGKKLLILGYGREGKSMHAFIRKYLPDADITIADQNKQDIPNERCIFGENYFDACAEADVILRSPGVAIKDNLPAEQQAKITGMTELFLKYFGAQTIGITGTKGKSTTSSLTNHILKQCGRKVILAGNIGKPVFDEIENIDQDTTVVLEISAHQLEYAKASPHIAILLNIYQEHLDHYLTAEDYYSAKKNIFRFQKAEDFLLYGDIFQHCSKEELDAAASHKLDIFIDLDADSVKTKLIGEHNRYNTATAIKACELVGVDKNSAIEAAASFEGLPHRLQFVGEFKGIKFYDDSIATAQEAAINAIESIPDTDTIILGGMDRGLDYRPIVDFLRQSTLRNVILLPATEESFLRIFNEEPYSKNIFRARDMEEAVKIAYENTAENHSCLLSPAAASYGFYKNFEERGDIFQLLVKKYAKL